MEWEAENQRKAEAWQEKQAQRNAIAIETARQQRDEDVAVAKALAEKRVQKAREGRKADELKRNIRNNAAQLNQMVLRPKPGKYVQKSLIVQAAEVAKLADTAVLNNNALTKLTALQDSIRRSGEMDVGIHADWENSGVENLIQTLRDDMNASKQAKLDRLRQQLEEAKALPDGDKAEQLRDRLRQRIREPHLSAHDGRPAADAEGHYGQHAAHHPDREQDPEPCEGRRGGRHGHEGRPRGAEL